VVLLLDVSFIMFDEIVTIFTSKPAGIPFDDGEAVGTDARHVRPTLARPNERIDEVVTLFKVALVVVWVLT
jgi:hypothetical protein